MAHATVPRALLEALARLFERQELRWQIHAGLASYLHGCYGKLGDVDLRVFTPDLLALQQPLEREFGVQVVMRGPAYFPDRIYLNSALVVGTTPRVEIASELVVSRLDWTFRFPFSSGELSSSVNITWDGLELPVAKLEFLCLYYAVLQRGTPPHEDLTALQTIVGYPQFRADLFCEQVSEGCVPPDVLHLLTSVGLFSKRRLCREDRKSRAE